MVSSPELPVIPSAQTSPGQGWRHAVARPSLPEIYRSLPIPASAGFLRKLLAFAGPGYLVAVGYMDPGNWATDLAGGSKYNYSLLSVIMLSNLMAILLQTLAIKLGVVTGRAWRPPVATTSPGRCRLSSGSARRSRSPPATWPK